MILTEQGQSFLGEVNRVFEALERAKAAVTRPTEGYFGNLSISLSTDLARFFAPKIAGFVHKHPNLDVAILARPSRESLAQVVNGEMDMGVGFFRKVPRGITKRKILETDISLVYPDGHPLGSRKRPTLEEISNYRVVMRRRLSPTRRVIDTAFSDNAIDPPRIVEVGRCQSAMDFVELGLGVGFVHTVCASAETHRGIRLKSMSHYFGTMDVSLITRSNAVLGSAHEALIQVFLETSPVPREKPQKAKAS